MLHTAAFTGYDLSLFVHITAVVVGFGATFAESVFFPVAQRLGTQHLPYVHRLQLTINRWFATPALVVVLLTGIYQVADGPYGFDEFWVSASFLIVIVLGGLIGAVFIPADRRLGPMAERELGAAASGAPAELSEAYRRGALMEGRVGGLAGVLIVAAIFLMVVKPGM